MKNRLVVSLLVLILLFVSCTEKQTPVKVTQWYETEVQLTFEDGEVDVITINIYTSNKEVDEDELYSQMTLDEGDFKYWRPIRNTEDWAVAKRITRASFVQRFKILSYKLIKQTE